jgi:hypothetical protein
MKLLNSWKEIATHLGCSVRTAQRFELMGLPVRRPAGHSRSAVVAFADEIDAWMASFRTGVAVVTSALVVHESEQQRRMQHEISELKRRIAECRQRSAQARLRAMAIRARRPFGETITPA